MARGWNIIWLIALFLVACAGTAPNVLHVQAGPGGLSSKKEEINDRWLARKVSFGEVSIRALDLGSSMEAQVILQNNSSRDVVFEYRFIWYDAAGFEISSMTAWIPSGLSGKEARGYRSTAPSPNAVSFKCMVRNLQPLTDTGS
ncbi:MAG: DUF1425 domain-containing protein [Desulfomonilia bacterium]|jgi:uncharacterized protein YcfL|uniref:DUF1425 domain-containing protein n=1 Tax=anaerobic digester metagenome TaxID=1263854 RepID=A0A485LYH8_9ZZZZ|nr:YcfL family protein [Pseudomonadota bacterium]HON37504.1 YcfL family protein [Deltaproteobacteria bacterium]HRS55610.1 YcfL family protein [Desulfomonilia bacterium]HPD20680.1 YcfL family protein [Deltaproteobacteria bacterium]HPX17619.1 YcfL family protein [Deltaproteobacteria bacterium]